MLQQQFALTIADQQTPIVVIILNLTTFTSILSYSSVDEEYNCNILNAAWKFERFYGQKLINCEFFTSSALHALGSNKSKHIKSYDIVEMMCMY